jgi:tRNA threonylcarbamoyladenosine biosynthesis protein TsaE
VRGLAEGLGSDPSEVTSPTFALIQEYRGGRLPLFHVDLYRVTSADVEDLGLHDERMMEGVTAIEWPDRMPRHFANALTVRIEHGEGSTRTIEISDEGR